MSKIVIALGGNALGKTPEEQLKLVKETAKSIVEIVKEGHQVIIAHGNGPQVGMINLAMDFAHAGNAGTPSMPFAECGAMSQGYIGYHLQQSISEELRKNNIKEDCVTIVTQVEVSSSDKAFNNPTKPVGMFYSKEETDKIVKEKGYTFVEDAGRGYRRVVPSPKPINIIELNTIKKLVDSNTVVISVGGGGIPVIKTEEGYKGVDAVIDKDLSSAKLATQLNADVLLILTAVEKVYINFNKENEQALDTLTDIEARKYIGQGEFAKGSMLPKVEACLNFVENFPQGKAIITSLDKAIQALKGQTGTVITKD